MSNPRPPAFRPVLPSNANISVDSHVDNTFWGNGNIPYNASNSYEVFERRKAFEDLKQLYLNGENCDVTIKVQEREFKAHRAILIARSPVLRSTFRSNMKEKETGIVNIEDSDPSSFSDFLSFLYCGEIALSEENVFSLFTTADKYDVQDLREVCLQFMKENLSVDSFCDALTLAMQHSESELYTAATDFFVKNARQIVKTISWQMFLTHNVILGNELLCKAFDAVPIPECPLETFSWLPSTPRDFLQT